MPLPLLAVPALAQAGYGLFQSLFSGRKKAEKAMEEKAKQSPKYTGGQSIFDYYNQAKQRASVSPTDLASYKTQMQNIGTNAAATTQNLQDRRSGLAGIGGIQENANRAAQNAVVQGEAEQNRRFGQLGSAAQMKTGEETKQYQYNALNPYLRQFQLAQQKSAAANARQEAGVQNLFSGASNLAAMGLGGASKAATGAAKVSPVTQAVNAGGVAQTSAGVLPNLTTNINSATMPNNFAWSSFNVPTTPQVNPIPLGRNRIPNAAVGSYRPPAAFNRNYNWLGQ